MLEVGYRVKRQRFGRQLLGPETDARVRYSRPTREPTRRSSAGQTGRSEPGRLRLDDGSEVPEFRAEQDENVVERDDPRQLPLLVNDRQPTDFLLFEPTDGLENAHFGGSRDDRVGEEVLRSMIRQVGRRLQREGNRPIGEDADGPLVLDDHHAADVLPGHIGDDLLDRRVTFRGHDIGLDELLDDDRSKLRSIRLGGALRRLYGLGRRRWGLLRGRLALHWRLRWHRPRLRRWGLLDRGLRRWRMPLLGRRKRRRGLVLYRATLGSGGPRLGRVRLVTLVVGHGVDSAVTLTRLAERVEIRCTV